jgi:8-oxo-dGTP pyrophosphatase MutT (NUDIX family)
MTPSKHGASITTLSSREVYRNHWLRLREDRILRSDGSEGIYGVVEKPPCAIIIPIQEKNIWLVEQYRYTIEERVMELPQGGWEEDAVHPEELARGELKEEMGLEAAEMTLLGSNWIAYGFTRQKQYVFLASGLTETEKTPDVEEHDLTSHCISIAEFEQRMLDGRIQDGCTLAAWGLYRLWKEQQQDA